MADRTVSVVLQARVTDYMAKVSAAGRATDDFANKVGAAKAKAAAGYHTIGLAGVAMGGLVVGGFGLAVKSAADFDAKMANTSALIRSSFKNAADPAAALASAMEQLRGAALHVGQMYGYTASQVADAEAELAKAGVSVKDMMGGALVGALTLASAGQTDVATATTIAATAMTQFALKGKDVPHIADLLAAGADKALGSVSDLGYALDQAGPTAHQFGLTIEETVGTLSAFAQAGQIGERGGTVLTQLLLKMTAPSKAASDIMKQLGLSIYGTNGQFVGMSNLAGQLQTKLSGLTQAERNHDLAVIFGQRAIRGANILYQNGAKGIADWITKTNDSGFAALQASGKLNSLSGDVSKLKAALQTAFIGAGESGQGPLRGMTQDVTKAIDAWNGLPGPVRGAAEALTVATGVVTLAGGAALLFIPKWVAMNAALKETSLGAISAEGALGALGKIGAGTGIVIGAYEGIHALNGLLGNASPSVRQFTSDLVDLSTASNADFGVSLSFFMKTISDPAVLLSNRFGLVTDEAHNLDAAFNSLVVGGHADLAARSFETVSSRLRAAGFSTKAITKLFPQYANALADSALAAKEAGTGVDQFGNKVGAAAKKTVTATDAAKSYSDALHAIADPLFAMNQALQAVTDAQGAASQAIHKYGKDSAQARQANLDLASAALDAEAAARTLAAGVKDGSVSIGDARKFLHEWVADGLLTKAQAQSVSDSFDHLIGRAQTLSGLHPNVKVTADTSQAESALGTLLGDIGKVLSGLFSIGNVTTRPIGGASDLVGLKAPVGSLPPASNPKSGKPKKYTPTTSDTGYTVPYSSGSAGGSGSSGSSGSGAGSAGTKQRPPTVQEIVHAILSGTIPPSINLLSKTLQKEIGHLSTVVGNAEQYRSTILSGLRGYAGLSNMGSGSAGTDILGASGPAAKPNVDAYLRGKAKKLEQFAHLLNRLNKEGLDKDLLSQFAQVGPDAIPAMQQLLGAGRRGIHKANRYENEINRYAGKATTTAVNDKYATALQRSVDKLPRNIERGVIKGLRGAHFHVGWNEGDRKGGHKVMVH